ncbi:MAG: hypothetical protein ACLP29_11775 [Dissulfurispiraceae bacterium]
MGKTKRSKGVKIMGIVDRNGLPLAVCTHAANHHEVTLVQLTVDFYKNQGLRSLLATRHMTAMTWMMILANKVSA